MKNEFLRHTLSTIHYRFAKAVQGSFENFGDFNAGKGSRSPKEIVGHMYDVIHSTRVFIDDETKTEDLPHELTFDQEVERFNSELIKMDRILTKKELDINYSKRLLQGPLADILTHIGQIAFLQRLNENPVDREDFSRSDIKTGLEDEEV